jgi:signal transduction histidine kinase
MNLKLQALASPKAPADHAISTRQPPPGHASAAPQAAPAAPQKGWRHTALVAWRWLQANTFTPSWLPVRWRHPATGYILVVLVQVLVAAIARLLCTFFPTYAFRGVVEILVVALIALNWGAGPGLFAALVGLVLEETVVMPVWSSAGQVATADLIEGVVFLAVGITISLVASATERSRRRALSERAEAQAHELAAMKQLQERMDEFLATASHDLRAPLTVTMGSISLATGRFERLAAAVLAQPPDLVKQVEATRRSLDETSQSVNRLARLVALLFDISLVRAGKLELHCVPCDLVAVVREPLEALRLASPQRTIDLQVLAAGPVPVVADADRIGQVVTNYLTNALKYSPEDQAVAVRVDVTGAGARVAVADHGPGLPQREHDRIWQAFYRAEGVRVQSGSGSGLGLGLHICKTIVERHGGQVGVESAGGQGSTFSFTLPLADATTRARPVQHAAAGAEAIKAPFRTSAGAGGAAPTQLAAQAARQS